MYFTLVRVIKQLIVWNILIIRKKNSVIRVRTIFFFFFYTYRRGIPENVETAEKKKNKCNSNNYALYLIEKYWRFSRVWPGLCTPVVSVRPRSGGTAQSSAGPSRRHTVLGRDGTCCVRTVSSWARKSWRSTRRGTATARSTRSTVTKTISVSYCPSRP